MLPISSAWPVDNAAGPPVQLPPRPLANRQILLVEDLPEPGRAAAAALQQAGADVVLEYHALAALALVLRSPQRFDAVVLDLQLSVLDTLETIRRLRTSGYGRPIVSVVCWDEALIARSLREAGCSAVLPRPLEAGQLVVTLSAGLDGAG